MKSITKKLSVCLLYFFMTLLLSSCTATHLVRSPGESAIYATLPDASHAPRGLYHSVAPGETLWRIARMYDVNVSTIKEANRIANVKKLDIGRELYIPDASPRKNVIILYPNDQWKYIIIHHSATEIGNSMQFNKAHLRRGWEGVGYHFIVDNGTCGKDDGQIETTPRWIKQLNGAHCKADNMNEKAIGICLVGNFSRDKVSSRQMRSLVSLVNRLRGFYKIPKKNIMGHGQVQGARTECPGSRFPWKKFWSRLARG